jgi:hypothetical protein
LLAHLRGVEVAGAREEVTSYAIVGVGSL